MTYTKGSYGVKRYFQQYISYIVAVSFIGEGNRRTQRKRPICRNYWQTLSHNVVTSTPCLSMIQTLYVSGDTQMIE